MRKQLNLPNILTLIRVLLVPVTVLLTQLGHYAWALGVFLLAAATDALDGRLARKNNQVTDLGKFLDPVADKVLVICAFVCLCAEGVLPVWFVCLVVFRELAVDGLRLAAARKGAVVAAALPGKIKTVLQMLLVALGYLSLMIPVPPAALTVLTAAAALMTLVSGIIYFVRLKDRLFD